LSTTYFLFLKIKIDINYKSKQSALLS